MSKLQIVNVNVKRQKKRMLQAAATNMSPSKQQLADKLAKKIMPLEK